ncbi:hypothetical protein TYRP_015270 [Tyrophagus putrescentiae]|nr:hypothetical protein TYRP_015270 [Tyrophagus putrescentiae]
MYWLKTQKTLSFSYLSSAEVEENTKHAPHSPVFNCRASAGKAEKPSPGKAAVEKNGIPRPVSGECGTGSEAYSGRGSVGGTFSATNGGGGGKLDSQCITASVVVAAASCQAV